MTYTHKGSLRAYEFAATPLQKIHHIYWVAGEEPLGQLEASDHIRQHLRKEGFEERLIFEGNAKSDWESIIFQAQERSMFSSKKWIEIKLTSLKLGKTGSENFLSLLKQADDEVVFLITSEKPDATTKKTAFYEYALDRGIYIESNPLTTDMMPTWLKHRLQKQGLSASPEALIWLTHHLEGNLLAADQEIKKLGLLYPHQTLTPEQLDLAITQLAKHDLDSLILAIMTGQNQRVAIAIDALEAEGEAPPRFVWVVYDLIRNLRGVCNGLSQKTPLNTLARQFRFWGVKEAALSQIVQRFPKDSHRQQLAFGRLLSRCAQLDMLAKGIDNRKTSGLFWQEAKRFSLSLSGLKVLKDLV
jgi:DNA polymerase-3 subunit delta